MFARTRSTLRLLVGRTVFSIASKSARRVRLGISIVAADLMLAVWTGTTYQIGVPAWLDGAVKLPIIIAVRANGTAVSTALSPMRC